MAPRRSRTKSIPEPVAAAFRAQLRAYVEQECDGNQSEAARALGFTQSHISSLMSGTRKIGLPILLHLRERTGRSIDQWLGLSPATPSVPYSVPHEEILAIVRAELDRRKP